MLYGFDREASCGFNWGGGGKLPDYLCLKGSRLFFLYPTIFADQKS